MSKYSLEEKQKAVEEYLKGRESYKSISKKYNIEATSIKKWVSLYNEHGIEGLVKKESKFDGNFKINVVEYMHENGMSARAISAKYNIPTHTTVMQWERIYLEEGAHALLEERRGRSRKMNKKIKLSEQTEKDLIAEVQYLRMENEYLKKLNALIQKKEKSARKTK